MDESSVQGRVCLVTGGGRGIGRACCLRIARGGADVAVNFHANEPAARETARQIESLGVRAHLVRADVSQPDQVGQMVADVQSQLGPIDLLVNNAGIFYYGDHREATYEAWQRTMEVNLTGTYLVTWAVKEGMIERGYGRIVNVASIAGLRARPQAIPYSVSKAGMIALTRSLAQALAAHGVRVNAVAPGLIDTEIHQGIAQEALDRLIGDTPISRFGRPEEIAESVYFLLSDQSSFTTGQTLVVDGGRVPLP